MASAARQLKQEAFANAVALQLRKSRKRQGLTQAQLAERTGGCVSKAALANYETLQRTLRIDVFWPIVRALDEDPGALLAAADRESGYSTDKADAPIEVDLAALVANTDPRLGAVKRWFALRSPRAFGAAPTSGSVTLDAAAITALAELMGTDLAQCRDILTAAVPGVPSVAV